MKYKKKEINYPLLIIILSYFWLLLTNIPYFAFARKIIVPIIIVFSIPVFIFSRKKNKIIHFNRIYFCLLLWSIIAAIYTNSLTNENIWFTLFMSIIVFCFAIQSQEEEKKQGLLAIFITTNIVTILSLLGYILIISSNIENSSNFTIAYSFGNFIQGKRLYGILNNPNLLGPIASLSCFGSIIFIVKNKQNKKIVLVNCILFLLNLYVLFLSGCRSALVSSIGVVFIIMLFSFSKNRKLIFFIFVTMGVLLAIIVICNLKNLTLLTGRDWVTGSGRIPIALNGLQLIKQSPLFGFGDIPKYINIANKYTELIAPTGSHNIYIEIGLLWGIPAMLLYILSIITVLINVMRCYFRGTNFFKSKILIPFCLLIYMIIFGLFEHQGLFMLTPMQIFFMLGFFLSDYYINLELHKHKSTNMLENKI